VQKKPKNPISAPIIVQFSDI